MPTPSDFTGTWRADLSASKLHGPTPNDMLVSIAHADPELRVEMTIIMADSGATRMDFNARTTGEATVNTVRGAQWVTRSRWIGAELLIESDVSHPGGQMHFCDYWFLSDDGQRLMMEHRADDLDGQITVLRRQD